MKSSNYFLIIFAIFIFSHFVFPFSDETEPPVYKLEREPEIRIGLIRNSYSATITTRDTSLVAVGFEGTNRFLNTTSVRVSSKNYQPPVFEYYRFETNDFATREEADTFANRIKTETGEDVIVLPGASTEVWKVRIGGETETDTEANNYVAFLTGKGFENINIIPTKYSAPSDDAVALTRQIVQKPKSKVRSLTVDNPAISDNRRPLVTKTSSSLPVRRKNMNAIINPALREVVATGRGTNLSSLRPITIGSSNSQGTIYLNGKRYRGKMEVFVNANGRITVVNVVPIEDYLLGVVPAELSLPEIEAQKAQAVAARTYALGNKDDYEAEGFDMVDTVWSQVYKGVRAESRMGTQAVRATRGMVATYHGKPINAMFTSTCGGRTEDSGNIYEFDLPYLKGVNCSLDGDKHFDPFLIKSTRPIPIIRNEANYEFVRLASKYAVNNFLMVTERFDDQYFEDAPTQTELKSWLNQVAVKFNKPFPLVSEGSAKPLKLARILHSLIYTIDAEADAEALMSEADINYQLSFDDAGEVPKQDRLILAALLRDGWFSIYSDLTIKPNKPYSRGKILNLIDHIYNRKKWDFSFETGTAKPTVDGKLILRSGRSEKEIRISPNVFLFRKFGDSFYQVKETALIGDEEVNYKTNSLGEVIYIEITPTEKTTVAERMSPFTNWRARKSAGAVFAGLKRYVKGLNGSLIDVKIAKRGFSKRAIELEILTTTGTFSLKRGKIRSALRLREQLFVMDKSYASNGRVTSFSFTGRGWGHGIGMCQYGAYGFAKMGVKYGQIIKHYYTGIDLVKAYS
jgi:stage II sporulation protein D